MGSNVRQTLACVLSIVLFFAASRAHGALPRYETRAAVASSPRAMPATGDMSDLRARLARDAAPRSLAAADLDGDGMPDLVAGFAVGGGSGLVAVWRGNPDALFPWSEAARRHREEGSFTDRPFLGPPVVLYVPEPAELLVAGDVDGDGASDVLAAARGSSTVYRFRGDGASALTAAPPFELRGAVTAWAVERDGLSGRLGDLAVGLEGTDGARLLLFEGPGSVLGRAPVAVPLPAPARALSFGPFGEGGAAGLEVRIGDERLVLQGPDHRLAPRPPAVIGTKEAGDGAGDRSVAPLGLRHQGTPLRPSALASLSNAAALVEPERVAAVVPLRLNADAVNDLVILTEGSVEPRVLLTTAAATYTVDSTADDGDFATGDGVCDTDDGAGDGPCTLRAALAEANVTAGGVIIDFAIPERSPFVIHSILPQNPLPEVTVGNVTLDASSQAVRLSGEDLTGPWSALVLTDSNFNVVRSLRIESFGESAIELLSDGNIVEACWIGRVFGSQQAVGNYQGIKVVGTANTVGGSLEAARNVISGNESFGVKLAPTGLSYPTVQGNYIGTDTSGLNPILAADGSYVQMKGVWIDGGIPTVRDNLIAANYDGISLTGLHDTIGSPALILGNSIGTDRDGTSALPNDVGIFMNPLVGLVRIGDTGAGEGNLISGNETAGIWAFGAAGVDRELSIYNNFIGTDVTGTVALPNPAGIVLNGAGSFASIGAIASGTGYGNLISGNSSHGVLIRDDFGMGTWHVFGENLIGTDAAGTGDLGNGGFGILIVGPAGDSQIGPDSAVLTDDANRIAFNDVGGVGLQSSSPGNFVGANEIFSNGGLGIDLVGVLGPDANDADDSDSGANGLQNMPVVEDLVSDGGGTDVTVSLQSTPNGEFRIQLYSSPACDPSGFGEGRAYLGNVGAATDGDGVDTRVFRTSAPVPAGHYVTATATEVVDTSGQGDFVFETSEFSACRREDGACPHPPDLVLAAGTFSEAASYSACQTITTAGDVVVEPTGSLELRAGQSVALGSGFRVGGSLQVVIDPSLDVP